MANDAFMKPEVPDAFRDLMKVSIEQAKRAFDTFAATSERTWKTFETSSQTASSGLRSLNEKIAEITRNNAEANFNLAMKLTESKDVSQAMELQTEHARKQMESFVHQLEEIRDLATQVIQDSTPTGMPGGGGFLANGSRSHRPTDLQPIASLVAGVQTTTTLSSLYVPAETSETRSSSQGPARCPGTPCAAPIPKHRGSSEDRGLTLPA